MNPSGSLDENHSAIFEKGDLEEQDQTHASIPNDRKSRGNRQHYLSLPPAIAGASDAAGMEQQLDLKLPEKQRIRDNA